MSGFSPELGVGFSVLVNVNTAFGHANIDGFIRGIANIILGTMPRSAKPSMIEKMALWFVYILPLVICLLAFNYIKQYRLGKKTALKRPYLPKEIASRLVFPSIPLLSISYVLLILVPDFYSISLKTFAISEPSVFIGVMSCVTVSTIWFILRTLLLIRMG